MFDNINIFYKDAEIHITEFTARKVIRLLKKRIANGDKSAQNYAFLADAYMTDKKMHKALKNALRAKAIDADYYYTYVILVMIYQDDGRFAKAEKYLVELFEKAPEDYELAYFCAILLYGQLCREQACKNYAKKLINLNRTTPSYLLFKSFAYLALGEFFNALKSILKAMLQDGKNLCIGAQIFLLSSAIFSWLEEKLNTELYISRGIRFLQIACLASKEEYYYCKSENFFDSDKKCLENIDKAISINPKPVYLIRKASILSIMGRAEEAIDIYKDVLQKDDSYVECYNYLCGAYQIIKDYKSALEYANLAILNNSTDETAYYYKIAILRKLKRPSDAVKVLEKLEKIYPESHMLYYIFAQTYADMEEYSKALLCINKQLIKEKDAPNYRDKMVFLFRLDRYEEALVCGKKALEYEEQGLIYYWISCCEAYLERFEDALDSINKAILLGEYDMWTFAQKSKILDELGREKEAKFAYQKAVELGYDE